MGVLKKCFTQNSSSEQALFIGCKARLQFLCVVCTRQNENMIYLTAALSWLGGYPTPYGTMLIIQGWGKKEEGEDVQSDGICLLKSPITHDEALLSHGWLFMETSLEWMSCFDLVIHVAFAFPVKMSLSTSVLTLILPILFPIPWRNEQVVVWGWVTI